MEYVLINYQGIEIKIPVQDFECELVDSDERSMGIENCYKLYNEDYGISQYIYEYPIGFFNNKSDWECDSNVKILEDTINYFAFFTQDD